MSREGDREKRLQELAAQLNSLEPVAAGKAVRELNENGLPATAQQVALLRNCCSSLSTLLEPSYEGFIRTGAMLVVARMCKLDRQCQDSFISYGAVRKLIKNADMAPRSDVDATAAVRALGHLVGGTGSSASHMAAVEDLFLSGTVLRMRSELAARRQPDDVTAAIGEFLAAVAACPASHHRLLDASLLPLLPTWMAPPGAAVGGASSSAVAAVGGPFVEAAYFLSLSEVSAGSMRTEPYFEGLTRAIALSSSLPNLRRAALLAMANLFGWDAGHTRAEETLRTHAVPSMIASLLTAALGPEDTGAAARAAGSNSAGPRRSYAGQGGLSRRMRTSDGGGGGAGGGAGGGMALPRGGGGSRAANGGGNAAAAAAALNALQQRVSDPSGASGTGTQTHGMAGDGMSSASLTAPGGAMPIASPRASPQGAGGGGGAAATGDGTVYDYSAIPLDAALHCVKSLTCNPAMARKLATPGTPSCVVPRLLDVIVSALQHLSAAAINRSAWLSRTAAATQTLLRLAACGELLPGLRAAGAISILRMLALEAEDPRVTEPARAALLLIGDGGHVGCTSRAAVAAFEAMYEEGDASVAGLEPEFDGRYHVFISHRRGDAHQFAVFTLYPILIMHGVPTFVDLHNRTLSGDWAHMITGCRNLVVVLTEQLLGSPEALREMEFAVAAGVHVVLAVPEGSRWPDAQGNKTFDSPPASLLDALPDRLRGVFTDKPLVYSAARHAEFSQQLLGRLRLPAPTLGDASDGESLSPSRLPRSDAGISDGEGLLSVAARGRRERRNPSEAGGRRAGRGANGSAWGDEAAHRVSFTSDGELPVQSSPQRTRPQSLQGTLEEAPAGGSRPGGGAAGPTAAACGGNGNGNQGLNADGDEDKPSLPWPWSRLFDDTGMGDEEEDGLQRYPRALSVGPGTGAGLGGGFRESVSGSAARMSSSIASPPLGAGGAGGGGILASHASRRAAVRQRSSLNRHAALQLQQQQQYWIVQQQWMTEYQQQQQLPGRASGLLADRAEAAAVPAGADPAGAPASASGAVGAGTGGADGDAAALSQLLALQLEMVRYEMRQAVQASHDMICHKIDRLRSDVTEQVVQLRFDLAGKIEAVQEALDKLLKAGVAAGAAAADGGVSSSNGSPGRAGMPPSQQQQQQQQQQQLAQALSSSLAASLQDAVNRAVAQLQASVMAAPAAAASAQRGSQSTAAMLAQAAAAQERHGPHPPHHAQPHGRSSVLLPPQPLGIELSPVARASAAAWSGEGGGNGNGAAAAAPAPSTKARNSHAGHSNGSMPATGRSSIVGSNANGVTNAAAAAGGRPTQLATHDAAGPEEDPGGPQRVMSPNALVASLTNPGNGLIMAGRTRQHAQGSIGGTTGLQRGTSTSAIVAAAAAVAAGSGVGKLGVNVLPPLTGQLNASNGSGTLSPPSAAKMVERTEPQPLRKAQQQMLLQQQQQQQPTHQGGRHQA